MLVHVYVIMGIEIHGQVFPMVPTNNNNSILFKYFKICQTKNGLLNLGTIYSYF